MTPEELLDVARSQLGVTESPASSNRTKYGKWYGMDGNPWCAMFVSWCFAQTGNPLKITTDKGYAYCPYGVTYFKNIGRWSSSPAIGAVVFYGTPIAEHTGIVESFTATTITAIEGNTALGNDVNGGAVMRRTRPRNGWILGYGLPVYEAKPTPTAVYGAVIELGDNVHKQDLTSLPLDGNGNGFIDTHIPWDSFCGVIMKGLHPVRDGWGNKEWNKPRWDANNTDGQATVVFTGGTPNKPVYLQALSA